MTEVAERQATFDEQFSNRQTLVNEAGNMKFVTISSLNPSPEPQNDLVAIPGWSITLGTQKDFIRTLATGITTARLDMENRKEPVSKTYYGRNVTACEFPRFGGKVEGREDMEEQVVRQAELTAQLILE